VKEGFPLWHGYRNWAQIPSMHDNSQPPACPPRISLFEDLVYWTTQQAEPLLCNNQEPPDHVEISLLPVIRVICAEWLVMCEHIKTRLGQIEWELGFPEQFRPDAEVIDISLKRLHTWRRLVLLYLDMLEETAQDLAPFISRARSDASLPTGFENARLDVNKIMNQLRELQARADRLSTVVVALISMEDSRRGLRENKNVARLTWLATLFIPLTFTTGLFSMQGDITSLSTTFGWYFATAIPMAVLILGIAWNFDRTNRKNPIGNIFKL
jgi:Mg2+ and Co2+ transporter CorA